MVQVASQGLLFDSGPKLKSGRQRPDQLGGKQVRVRKMPGRRSTRSSGNSEANRTTAAGLHRRRFRACHLWASIDVIWTTII